MPIEIQAKLLQRAVFFAGESVHCEISITYVNEARKNEAVAGIRRKEIANCDLEKEHTVAWASGQIYCQCHVNESKVKMPFNCTKGQISLPNGVGTSFIATRGETGHCFLSTKQTILFCNQKFCEGQTKKFIYTEEIPADAPPSYRGQAVRYSYKITIGVGFINAPTKLIRLPIRILGAEDIWISRPNTFDQEDCSDPFLEDAKMEDHSKFDLYLDHLTCLTSQKNTNVYNISCNKGSAGKFSLSKACYRIGEDVQGSFDFGDSTVRCIKYKVVLQSEERIQEQFQRPSSRQKTPYTSYSKYDECCIDCRQTSFSLPIPIIATPEFSSKIVSLRWRLHCEFFTLIADEDEQCNTQTDDNLDSDHRTETFNTNNDNIPKKIKVETLTWDVPVKVVATNPIQISLTSSNTLAVSDVL